MMSKKNLTCYLVGPIQDTSDGGVEWRKRITPKLEELGIEVINPTISESEKYGSMDKAHEVFQGHIASGNWDLFDKVFDEIIRMDMEAVKKSDFLIVLFDPTTKMGGTICEIWEAVEHCKTPIYTVCYSPKKDFNVWMLRTLRKGGPIFDNFAQVVTFIEEKHRK